MGSTVSLAFADTIILLTNRCSAKKTVYSVYSLPVPRPLKLLSKHFPLAQVHLFGDM